MAGLAKRSFRLERRPSSSSNTAKLLSTASDLGLIESSDIPYEEQDTFQQHGEFDAVGLLATTTALLCLLAAILVVLPDYWLSWKLGFTGQIVCIGFLMSTMNLCLQTVVTPLFLKIESRWGRSSLQTYDAILRNRFLISQVGALWRTLLIFLAVLPIGLGVAYKQFLGGTSQRLVDVTSFQNNTYGTAFPSLGDFAMMDNSMFLMIHPIANLLLTTSDDSKFPTTTYPAAFGYNVLLLSPTSSAMLDIPMPDLISQMQSQLRHNESWHVTATTRAYIARYNQSLTDLARGPTSYWNKTLDYNEAHLLAQRNMLNAKWMYYEGLSFGAYQLFPTNNESSTVFLGAFIPSWQSGDFIDTFDYTYDRQDYLKFTETAMAFSINRGLCSASWQVTSSGIKLLQGSCMNESMKSGALSDPGSLPFAIDTLPPMVFSAGPFAAARNKSPWVMPVFTTSAVCMYWSLGARRLVSDSDMASKYDMIYPSIDQVVKSSIPALHATWLLYLVLAVQPLMAVAAYVGAVLMSSSPIGRGFGLISILAGVDRPSLDILRGAELSGKVSRPVVLAFTKPEDQSSRQPRSTSQRVRYVLHQT